MTSLTTPSILKFFLLELGFVDQLLLPTSSPMTVALEVLWKPLDFNHTVVASRVMTFSFAWQDCQVSRGCPLDFTADQCH